MNYKTIIPILGGLLGIACGEAIKLGYTEWIQLGSLEYWLGMGIQTASLLGVYTGGLYQSVPGQPTVPTRK